MNKDLVKALECKNRANINKEFKKLYDRYFYLAYFSSLRIVGDKEEARKIANEAFSILFKNIYESVSFEDELSYLSLSLSEKKAKSMDNTKNDYLDILQRLNTDDETLYFYVSTNLYNRSYKGINEERKISKKHYKRYKSLSLLKFDSYNALDIFEINPNYDDIYDKIEMPKKGFLKKDKIFIKIGLFGLILSVVLFIIAFVNALIPSSKSSISTTLFYVCMVSFAVGIIGVLISSMVNKYNKNNWK